MIGDFSFSLAGSGDVDAARAAFKQFLATLKAPGSPVTVTSGQFTASEGVDQLVPEVPAAATSATDPAAPPTNQQAATS